MSSSNIVPDVLLALAKDARYLEQCKTLLLKILPLQQFTETRREMDASFVANICYIILVLMQNGKSLGQEAVNVEYKSGSKWRLVVGSFVASTTIYLVRRLAKSAANESDATQGRTHETLRGRQRQLMHEQQRRRMMERAASNEQLSQTERQSGILQQHTRAMRQSIAATSTDNAPFRVILHQSKQFIQRAAQELASGLSMSDTEGPHSTTDSSTSSNLTTFSLGAWLFRLHLAWYCLDTRYPTWMHRLFRLELRQNENESKLTHKPTTARIVGLLILLQALGTLVPHVGSRLVEWLADCFPASLPAGAAKSPIEFYSNNPQCPLPASSALNSSNTRVCVICRQTRNHPACSVKCGHVMCWSCLQQWVQQHESCPICRVPCLPQQIMALQNYQGNDGGDD